MKQRLLPSLMWCMMMSAAVAATFEEWRAEHFTVEELNLTLSSEAGDPDGDGKANLLEFATNTNPKSPDFGLGWTTGRDPQGRLTLGFTRWKSYSGLLYAPQVSSGLTDLWKAGSPEVTETGAASLNAETDWVSVRDFALAGSAPRRFMRLLVALDEDEDGLPDDWEIGVFGDIEVQSGGDDFDLDSLSNLLEWQKG